MNEEEMNALDHLFSSKGDTMGQGITPQGIRTLLQQSPALREAMDKDKPHLWQFLRHEVKPQYAVASCVQCQKIGILLETPYRADLCIECLLKLIDELRDDPIIDMYSDKRSRMYEAKYAESQQYWTDFYTVPEDYDGPPIAIA